MTLSFIGLGLSDEKGLTVEGLEKAREASSVFAEFYTNIMPGLDRRKLENLVGQEIVVLGRTQLEDEGGSCLIEAALRGRVAFLVPGDPMIATTHVSIRLELAKRGIASTIIHGPSITSAVCGATGLQNYKFGKSVTLPEADGVPGSVLDAIRDNKSRGLHTLVLLDVKPELQKQLDIRAAAMRMMGAEPAIESWIGVGAARVGAGDQRLLAAPFRRLQNENFGKTPHSLVVPGKLHFMEAEALKAFCGADDADLETLK